MGASDIEPGYYENTFILKNISQKPLKKNWTIYYSQLPRGVKQEGASEVKVEVVNGNFFKMYPTDEFASLAPGDSMRITFLCLQAGPELPCTGRNLLGGDCGW